MKIRSAFKEYQVNFCDDLSSAEKLAEEKDAFFVLDHNVYEHYQEILPHFPEERLFLMDAVEEKKNMDAALAVCERMTVMAAKRNAHLVSIGGGITQDVTGFVAANLYRGIQWTFFPTTLLAACDSCIGGKSSLNYKGFKNLLGSFYPPDEILIDPQFFRGLTLMDYCSGLGEVLKFNVIAGDDGVLRMERDLDDILAHDYAKLLKYVRVSLEFKKKFIEEDEFDRGRRILLNYAHTFGHAFETTSHYALPHGSAVALGMITANQISVMRGYISENYAERIQMLCSKILQHIPWDESWFSMDAIMAAVRKDKKQTSENITAVLMNRSHQLEVFHDVQENEIDQAIHHLLKYRRS